MVFNNTRTFAWKLWFHGYFTMKNENLHHFSEIITIILFILFYVYIYIIIIITKSVKKQTKSQAAALYQWEILTGSYNNAFLHQSNATRCHRGGVLAGTAAVTTTSPRGALATLPHECKINRYIVLYFILQTKLFTSFVRFVDIS